MEEYIAEFVGTFVLIAIGCGVNAAGSLTDSYAKGAGWIMTALGWGLAVTMGIYAAGSISGAHLNPAVTLGFLASGEFPADKTIGFLLAQMLGAIAGAMVIWLQYLPHWKKTEDKGTKLGVFSTGPAIPNQFPNLLSEMIGTFFLLFVISMIGSNDFQKGFNPIAVGALVVAIGMAMGGSTGYAINPARDLGPRIAHFLLPITGKGDSNWGYSWIPVLGPILGGMQGTLAYHAIFSNQMGTVFYTVTAINVIIIFLAIQNRNR